MRRRAPLSLLSLLVACLGRGERRAEVAPADAAPSAGPSASARASEGTSPSAPAPAAPRLARRDHGAWGVAYAPADLPARPPPIIFLHGNGSNPEESCPYFEPAVAGVGLLVCARGNLPSGWSGLLAPRKAAVDAAVRAAEPLAPDGALAQEGGVLLGFSSGAATALEVALAEPGRFRGLVLMSMPLSLSSERLRAAGVARVVLATARNDASYASLRDTARALRAAGLPARFLDFGLVGHHFAKDMERQMRDAVTWVRSTDPATLP